MAQVTTVQVLAGVGAGLLAPLVYRLLNFIWLYFLRPNTVHTFLHTPSAYALVTGATDGIGKAVAQELYDQGFNLILHGRSEEKMRKVAEQIRSRGARDVLYFIADASATGLDYERLLRPYRDLQITLVIHNVGGQSWTTERVDGLSESDIYETVQKNALFSLLLTRTLLPKLRASAKNAPVLVQFVGSMAGEISPVRFSVYAGSKGFLKALVRGLDNDEHFWDGPSGVQFEYLMVGQVQSNSVHCAESWGAPSSERFAKAMIGRMGCGWRKYAPYWPHATLLWTMELLGEKTIDKYTAQAMRELGAAEEKRA